MKFNHNQRLVLLSAFAFIIAYLVYMTGFLHLSIFYSGYGYIGGDFPQPIPNYLAKIVTGITTVLVFLGVIGGIWGGVAAKNWKWLIIGLILAGANFYIFWNSGVLQLIVRELGMCEVHGGYPWGVSRWCKWYPL